MKSLDPESKKFISWGINQLQDDKIRAEIYAEVLESVIKFLQIDRDETIEEVHYKLIRGGLEHGVPIYPEEQIKLELDDELKDLIGWNLVGRYNKLLKAKSA